jgi:predicted kinase
MQRVILLRGLPASGKSTWAKTHVLSNQQWKRINRDELRKLIDAGKYTKSNEKFIRQTRDSILRSALESGNSVVIDDTNFEQYQVDHIRAICREFNVPMEIKDFNVDPFECIKRNALRSEDQRVPEEVIWDMYNKYIKPNEYKMDGPLAQNQLLPPAIICDLDGTLALINGRSPYNCNQCGSDIINPAVDMVLKSLIYDRAFRPLFVSGRNSGCRKQTEEWLVMAGYGKYLDTLFMREEGDNRKDSEVKLELFNNHIRDNYYVELVLDDRDQVVRLWRSLGLPCFQVNYGNF